MATLTQSVPSSDSYFEALAAAERRALHSFFDQHVVEDDDLGHFAFDEGDYNALPAHLASRIVHTVPRCDARVLTRDWAGAFSGSCLFACPHAGGMAAKSGAGLGTRSVPRCLRQRS